MTGWPIAAACFSALSATTFAAEPNTLVAHWPLKADTTDSTGHGHNGTAANVSWPDKVSAQFDGRKSVIEIPDHADLKTGGDPFSVAAWVYTETVLDDALGDVLSKFDPGTRKGFNLSIMNYPGVTSGQPNWRNVHFGIDDAAITQPWTDCGRPGQCKMLWSLCVWNDNLYASTFELEADQAGHVYRYAGCSDWEDCGSPDKANAVTSLAVFKGQLYAATACYDSIGSSLPPSPNRNPGGKVYRFDGPGKWSFCGQLENPDTGTADTVHNLVVYRGKLYAGSMYRAGKGLYEYQGNKTWKYLGHPGCRVDILGVYNGDLYTTSYDAPGIVARWNPTRLWQSLGAPPDTSQTYAFMPYEGRLSVATWPNATVYRLTEDDRWISQGRLGEENETMGMVVYNGKLYAGSLPLAKVFRHDGGTTWTDTGRIEFTPDMLYRRVWSMAVFRGKLFAGTMPGGHVWSFEAGQNVTCDRELPPGWHHLAAVRASDHLRLYIDGKLAARSPTYPDRRLDVSNTKPLRIGFGSHDHFNGRLADVRFYREALTGAAVASLAKSLPAPQEP